MPVHRDVRSKYNPMEILRTRNKLIRGIIFGSLAGILCILAWTRVTVRFGYNPFWYGPMIGLFVGIAVAYGSRFNRKSGLYAMVISLVALIAGKYINTGIEMNLRIRDEKILEIIAPMFSRDETMIATLADDIVESYTARGDSLHQPLPLNRFSRFPQNGYSSEIWNTASEAWNSLTDSSQTELRDTLIILETDKVKNHLMQNRHDLHEQFFRNAFKGMHLLYGMLTLASAYIIPRLLEKSRDQKKKSGRTIQ